MRIKRPREGTRRSCFRPGSHEFVAATSTSFAFVFAGGEAAIVRDGTSIERLETFTVSSEEVVFVVVEVAVGGWE